MEYRYHDGAVLRREALGSTIELHGPKRGWRPFPEPADGDIRKSSTTAWLEGSPLTKKEADAKIKQLET